MTNDPYFSFYIIYPNHTPLGSQRGYLLKVSESLVPCTYGNVDLSQIWQLNPDRRSKILHSKIVNIDLIHLELLNSLILFPQVVQMFNQRSLI